MPALGSLLMLTASSVLLSLVSLKPKSVAAKVLLPSSSTVRVLLVPLGASLTGTTAITVLASVLDWAPPEPILPPSLITILMARLLE